MAVCRSLTSPGVQGERQWQFIPQVVIFNRSTLHVSRSAADTSHSDSQLGMEAHHSLDGTEDFRGGEGGKTREREEEEERERGAERGREKTQHPPFVSTHKEGLLSCSNGGQPWNIFFFKDLFIIYYM